MINEDPLAGADAVDWANLPAHSPAEQIPEWLRALRSDASAARGQALQKLCDILFHQGERYVAAASTVPFLLALAADPTTPQRDRIIHLLVILAIGDEEESLPGGLDIAHWRAEIARMQAGITEHEQRRHFEHWITMAADQDERRWRASQWEIFSVAAERLRVGAGLAAYDAVGAGIGVIRDLLGDGDPALRAAAAYALGWFPEQAAESGPLLAMLLDTEDVPGVAVNAIISAGLLPSRALVPRLQQFLRGSEPLTRCAAAIALANLGALTPEVTTLLAFAGTHLPQTNDPLVCFMDGNLRGYASLVLLGLDGAVPAAAVDAVLDGLSRSSGTHAYPIALAALRLTFGNRVLRPLPPFEDLLPAQQRAVRVLAELDHSAWRWWDFVAILDGRNLPRTRSGCRRYAGLEEGELTADDMRDLHAMGF
ncbi:HEAT repeat domain-containing protein [Spirillospora sp. NPDC029432]|uniref:HEAT repeat domain-containing protein n=1 Tax=Spirillospora sp. NPDC029432 TaxID=3154599 RepID=UPI0034572BE5